jgi:hypothetical protein
MLQSWFPLCSLGSAMCLGVTAGAYVLTLFAVSVTMRWLVFGLFSCWVLAENVMCTPSQTKYQERVLGLMLVSLVCKAPSWCEWLYNKVITSSFISVISDALCPSVNYSFHYAFSVLTSESHVPGIIKLALLLWDTWISQGKFALVIFQHGTFDPPSAFLSPFSSSHPYRCLLSRFTQGCFFVMLCLGCSW